VQYFLANNPELLHETDEHNNSVLYISAHSGQIDVVRYLLEKGARDDECNRAYLSALTVPIRHLLKKYKPDDGKKNKEKKNVVKTWDKLFDNFVTCSGKDQKTLAVDDSMRMGGVIFFAIGTKSKPSFKCHLIPILCRWKGFASRFLGENSEQISSKVKLIHQGDKNSCVISLKNVDEEHFKIILQYIYTGKLATIKTAKKTTESADLLNMGHQIWVDEDALANVLKLRESCQELCFQEIVEVIDTAISALEIDLSIDATERAQRYEVECNDTDMRRNQVKKQLTDLLKNHKFDMKIFRQSTTLPEAPLYRNAPIFRYRHNCSVLDWELQQYDFACRQLLAQTAGEFHVKATQAIEELRHNQNIKFAYQVIDLNEVETTLEDTHRQIAIAATFDVQIYALPFSEVIDLENEEMLTPMTPVDHSYIPNVMINCHKDLLMWKSEYFKVAMGGNFQEATELKEHTSTLPQFKVYNCSDAALIALVQYAYTEQVDLNKDIVVELLFLSMRCEMDALKRLCVDFLSDNLSFFQNKVDVLMIADLVNNTRLKNNVLRVLGDEYAEEYRKLQLERNAMDETSLQEVKGILVNKLEALEISNRDIEEIMTLAKI
jgi:hypothetical protein